MKKLVLVMLCIMSIAIGCKKSYRVPDKQDDQVWTEDLVGGVLRDTQSYAEDDVYMSVLGGNASSSTPIPGTWWIKTKYLNQYQHYCQLNASPQYPGGVLCGPTSYMLGVHMIAASKQLEYASNKSRLGIIHGRLLQNSRFDDDQGMYISDVDWYAKRYDASYVFTSYKRTSDRTLMKEFIEYNIKTGFPVVVTVQVYGKKRSSWVYDGELYGQVCVSNYISKDGPIGHFILLVGIKINADGTGTVWYKDPLSPDGNTQSVSYTRLLDAMKYNGNTSYYDAISIFE